MRSLFSCLLLQYKGILFFEEMASIFVTPFILWFYLPEVRSLSVVVVLLRGDCGVLGSLMRLQLIMTPILECLRWVVFNKVLTDQDSAGLLGTEDVGC